MEYRRRGRGLNISRPTRSFNKRTNFPSVSFNPFFTVYLPELGRKIDKCMVKLDCGHECSRECTEKEEFHSSQNCIHLCERICPRGHRCGYPHPCRDPCQPCIVQHYVKYECGHSIKGTCNDDELFEHCELRCGKTKSCGHVCYQPCIVKCEPCQEFITSTFPNCDHEFIIKCSENREIPKLECPVLVEATDIPDCGHLVLVPCKDKSEYSKDSLSDRCDHPCGIGDYQNGGCGHPCSGVCSSCKNGIFHERCIQLCERILICGHICEVPCTKNCSPCEKKCQTSCEHGVCKDPCGVPCPPCDNPCTWQCPHQKCTLKCNEVCNRKPCELPCPKILLCGHLCIGLCGEQCPKLCLYCDGKALMECIIDGRNTIDENDRFIYLIDCGHTLEVETLDRWMNAEEENGEIIMKSCPFCRKIIWTCRRYSAILHRKFNEVNDVKIKVYGDLKEIHNIRRNVLSELMVFSNNRRMFDSFRVWLIRHMTRKNNINLEPIEMNQATVNCLEYLTRQLIISEERFTRFSIEYGTEEFNVLEHYYREIWYFVEGRGIPLTMTETADLDRQLRRIDDIIQLMDRKVNATIPRFLNIQTNPTASEFYDKAYGIIVTRSAYTSTTREKFIASLENLDTFLHCQLGITEKERKVIVRIFGMRAGRWFKCRNGHIYVVTECGGPTEVGVCNECGDTIGGTEHVTVEGNELAIEMDGAIEPLYPTALMRNDPVDDPVD